MRHPSQVKEFSTRITPICGRKRIQHGMRRHATQTRFSVNAWADIIGDHLVGTYLLPFCLTGHNYLIFLQQILLQLSGDEDISTSNQQTIRFQHDGTPAHYSRNVRKYPDCTNKIWSTMDQTWWSPVWVYLATRLSIPGFLFLGSFENTCL